MSKSPFYPATPHPITMLHTHPKFIALMRAPKIAGKSVEANQYYGLDELRLRVAKDPDRYVNGIDLQDFMEECASNRDAESLVAELERMNVYKVVHNPFGSKLVPVAMLEAEQVAKAARTNTSLYIQITVLEAAKAAAAERHLSMSRLMELALIAYLGLPSDPAAP